MTSKEALKRIETAWPFNKEGKESVYRAYMCSSYYYYQDFDLVMRDLEVLEILKKYLFIVEPDNEEDFKAFDRVDYLRLMDFMSREEYEVIKEWLYDK